MQRCHVSHCYIQHAESSTDPKPGSLCGGEDAEGDVVEAEWTSFRNDNGVGYDGHDDQKLLVYFAIQRLGNVFKVKSYDFCTSSGDIFLLGPARQRSFGGNVFSTVMYDRDSEGHKDSE